MSKKIDLEKEEIIMGVPAWKLTRSLLLVGIYILVSRLFFTFLIAVFYGRTWHVEFFSVIPVIAFNSDDTTFRMINTLSTFLGSLSVYGVYLYFLLQYIKEKKHRLMMTAWYLGSTLTIVQFLVLWIINDGSRFSFDPNVGLILVPAIFILSSLFYSNTRN